VATERPGLAQPDHLHLVSELLVCLLDVLPGICGLATVPCWQEKGMISQRDRLGLTHLYQLEPILECLLRADLSPWQDSLAGGRVAQVLELTRPWLGNECGPTEVWSHILLAAVDWSDDIKSMQKAVRDRTSLRQKRTGSAPPAEPASLTEEDHGVSEFIRAGKRLHASIPVVLTPAKLDMLTEPLNDLGLDMLAERLNDLGAVLREQGISWLIGRLRVVSELEKQALDLYQLAVAGDRERLRAELGTALRPRTAGDSRACELQRLLTHELLDRLGWWSYHRRVVDILGPARSVSDAVVNPARQPAAAVQPGSRVSRGGRDRKQEARDKWIYRECCKGREMSYDAIIAELKKRAPQKSWEPIESIQGIRAAAIRYAQRNQLPQPPNRQDL
jgi:hypothetical protein